MDNMIDEYQFMIDREKSFEKDACKQIYLHREEFEDYKLRNKKVAAVKVLKDYTGGGLMECLDIINLYMAGKLKSYIVEERKRKLKILNKKILTESLILNIKNIDVEELVELFSKLSYDTIESISSILESFEKEKLI